MYKKIDCLKVSAMGLAAAVMISLPSHGYEGCRGAVKGCLLFPQFAEAASSEREVSGEAVRDGEVVYAFRIAELWDKLVNGIRGRRHTAG